MLSWAALYLGGIHPALALVPIVPFIPHSARDLRLFDPGEPTRARHPESVRTLVGNARAVRLALLRFSNAGVALEGLDQARIIVLIDPSRGKAHRHPALFGPRASSWADAFRRGCEWPIWQSIGIVASIGFTVSLFFATAAFSRKGRRSRRREDGRATEASQRRRWRSWSFPGRSAGAVPLRLSGMNRRAGSNDFRFESCAHDSMWTGRLSASSTNTWFC